MLSLVLDDPVSYVRRGSSAGLAHLAPHHPIWLGYAKAATPIARVTAKRAAAQLGTRPNPHAAVLDVAAGYRFCGIELAKAFPEAVVTLWIGRAFWSWRPPTPGRLALLNAFVWSLEIAFERISSTILAQRSAHPSCEKCDRACPRKDEPAPWTSFRTEIVLRELDEIAKAGGFRGAAARPLRPTPQSLVMFKRETSSALRSAAAHRIANSELSH